MHEDKIKYERDEVKNGYVCVENNWRILRSSSCEREMALLPTHHLLRMTFFINYLLTPIVIFLGITHIPNILRLNFDLYDFKISILVIIFVRG